MKRPTLHGIAQITLSSFLGLLLAIFSIEAFTAIYSGFGLLKHAAGVDIDDQDTALVTIAIAAMSIAASLNALSLLMELRTRSRAAIFMAIVAVFFRMLLISFSFIIDNMPWTQHILHEKRLDLLTGLVFAIIWIAITYFTRKYPGYRG